MVIKSTTDRGSAWRWRLSNDARAAAVSWRVGLGYSDCDGVGEQLTVAWVGGVTELVHICLHLLARVGDPLWRDEEDSVLVLRDSVGGLSNSDR